MAGREDEFRVLSCDGPCRRRLATVPRRHASLGDQLPFGGFAAEILGAGVLHPSHPCAVPLVVGRSLLEAKAAIASRACAVGRIRRAYSSTVRKEHVISPKPRRGTVLAHAAPVDLLVSRGRR